MRLINADELKKECCSVPDPKGRYAELRIIEDYEIDDAPTIIDTDNPKNGKEVLIKYCLDHSGEEIYNFLKQIFDASMSWTDSRGFIIEWLEKGGMI